MKKLLSACAVAAAFVAAPAFAQGYVGIGAGSSKVSGTDLTTFGVNYTGVNSSKSILKLFGGYQFTPNWGVEAQFSDLGKRTEIGTQNGVVISAASAGFKQYGVAAIGTLPLSNEFSVFGKLGVSANKVDTLSGVTSALVGVGVSYKFTANLSARLEYEDFGKLAQLNNGGGTAKGSAYSVGLKYSF